MKINKLLSIMLLPLFLMAGCGGSSSTDSSPTTPVTPITPPVPPVPPVPTVNKIKVVPALGAFGAGANVAFIRPDGSQIAAAQTNAAGAAELDMGSYTGPFISKVTGGPGVTFYNEKTLGRDPFGANDTLLAIVPSVPKASSTGEAPSLGVTALTNAAASVLIANPASPSISGTVAATIASEIAVANATVAVAAGLPAGVDMLSAPQALSSPTDKITSTNPAAVAYGAYIAALAQAAPTNSILDSVKAMAADSKANKGSLPTTAKTFTDAGKNLAAVVTASVATASQTAGLTALTTAFKPDPTLTLPASQALITTAATAGNGGVAPSTPVVFVPPVVTPPVVTPPVVTPPVVTPPVVTPPVVTPPVVTPPAQEQWANTCSAPTINSATNGTFSVTINSVSYAGSIVNGILFANNAGLNASGSGSGVVSGTVSGSSSGNDGYVLSSGLRLVTGTATGTAVLNGVTYNMRASAGNSNISFTCP
jgi:hypothetical protein